jgi:hypothetical protein
MDGGYQGSADLLPDDSWLEDYCDKIVTELTQKDRNR